MEARLLKDKVAYDIKTREEIMLLAAGDRVPVEEYPPDALGKVAAYRIAPDERYGGLIIASHEADILLTIAEVAQRVGRSEGSVLRWLQTGFLEGEKVPGKGKGGQWRVKLSALDNLVLPRSGPKGAT